jgi:hypothetical protein
MERPYRAQRALADTLTGMQSTKSPRRRVIGRILWGLTLATPILGVAWLVSALATLDAEDPLYAEAQWFVFFYFITVTPALMAFFAIVAGFTWPRGPSGLTLYFWLLGLGSLLAGFVFLGTRSEGPAMFLLILGGLCVTCCVIAQFWSFLIRPAKRDS